MRPAVFLFEELQLLGNQVLTKLIRFLIKVNVMDMVHVMVVMMVVSTFGVTWAPVGHHRRRGWCRRHRRRRRRGHFKPQEVLGSLAFSSLADVLINHFPFLRPSKVVLALFWRWPGLRSARTAKNYDISCSSQIDVYTHICIYYSVWSRPPQNLEAALLACYCFSCV